MYDSYCSALSYLLYCFSIRAAAKVSHDDLIVIYFTMLSCGALEQLRLIGKVQDSRPQDRGFESPTPMTEVFFLNFP